MSGEAGIAKYASAPILHNSKFIIRHSIFAVIALPPSWGLPDTTRSAGRVFIGRCRLAYASAIPNKSSTLIHAICGVPCGGNSCRFGCFQPSPAPDLRPMSRRSLASWEGSTNDSQTQKPHSQGQSLDNGKFQKTSKHVSCQSCPVGLLLLSLFFTITYKNHPEP